LLAAGNPDLLEEHGLLSCRGNVVRQSAAASPLRVGAKCGNRKSLVAYLDYATCFICALPPWFPVAQSRSSMLPCIDSVHETSRHDSV